ncbi:MAG: hypothetical protein V1672_03380 [Candidatus Diapherotrites archaeon]
MMGFTLSKLNMLIFVTSIFVIVTFFMSHLAPLAIQVKANQQVNKVAQLVSDKENAQTVCAGGKILMPQDFTYFGSSALSGKRFFYTMRISKIERPEPDGLNRIIFKILERGTDKLIAADIVHTTADVRIFGWELNYFKTGDKEVKWVTDSTDLEDIESEGYYAEIDSQKGYLLAPPDTLYVIKENYEGKDTIYLFTCPSTLCATRIGSSSADSDLAGTQTISKIISDERSGLTPVCIDVAEYVPDDYYLYNAS